MKVNKNNRTNSAKWTRILYIYIIYYYLFWIQEKTLQLDMVRWSLVIKLVN